MTLHYSYAAPWGAQLTENGVRFRLWAPGEKHIGVLLEDEDQRLLPMTAGDGGWFECTTAEARAGSRYRYVLGDGGRVPDPASRLQPADAHGASEVIDPRAYAWTSTDWRGRPWAEAVIYEVHLGAFTPAGNYDGARGRIEHLAAFGVTALELMPLSDFAGSRNWGYDGVLPFAPAAAYGRPDDLKHLIDAAHARGLMIFLDVVYNHFGPSGNYLARYAPDFFTVCHHTPWGEAIDFTRREVREFFIHNALYWLEEYRFDGLRFDAVDQIRDPSPVHILTEIAETVRERITDRHVHLVLENDDNAARYLERDAAGKPRRCTAQWNDDFHHVAHVLATGEGDGYYADYAGQPAAALARALAEGFVYQGEHSAYRNRPRGERSAHLPPLAFVNFLQNHDQIGNRAYGERLTALAPPERLRALYALLFLSPSVPLLFMGEEWAAGTPFLYFCDYTGELASAVRSGRRAEFARFAGFRDPRSRADIPDPNVDETFVRSRLVWPETREPRHGEWLAFLSNLIACRRRELVPRLAGLASGRRKMLDTAAFAVAWPLAGGGQWQVAANLGAMPLAAPATAGRLVYAQPVSAEATLPAWSVRVVLDE
ncbi:MAG: malto-oligosyltrehalose trehalohydrolase [Gammaproteobacteria bacterium]|nr:malto-oligosyltrehalose trehalohydrolase [Gammaproteobacteria bacterium]